ncbi:phage tail-collar fiber domain-containing protein [Neisseria wadsworthii]|uniref:Phage tail fibre protein N-terminal domain-containing protein n=1 Tax=Neisseria wadsworthii 9715 TaxID=1030841 RepID=G4CPH8_9NEIS|nr:phage tail protein [Neisseria wadsworthii]EGZ47741.1 hypothetical protein HMPREF9370_0988 [Neisseria wadsworthii 9715]
MTQKYYTLLTNIGAARLANAAALGNKINLTEMAVGDGGGADVVPNAAARGLVREVYRGAVNSLEVDPKNTNQIIAEIVITEEVGDFTIREVGIFDAQGNLFAYGNLPATYKPVSSSGSARTQTIRMVLQVSNSDSVRLKIDPAIVLATREYVDAAARERLARVGSVEELRLMNKAGVKSVFVHGYYKDRPGIGGGIFVADDADRQTADDGAMVIVSADGTRWRRADKVLSVEMFGAIGDGELHLSAGRSLDGIAIQRFIDYAAASGGAKKCLLRGHYVINHTIVLKKHAYLMGDSAWTSLIEKASGFNGDALKTDGFDALKAAVGSLADCPYDFGVCDIKFDGRYISNSGDAYINTSGGGLKIIGTQFKLVATVFNQAGVGVYLSGKGEETVERYRDGKISLRIDTTKDEGFIFAGPHDLKIDKVFCRRAGAVLSNDPKRWTLWATENYPSKQRVDGIVFETAGEIDLIHSWGHEAGYGVAVNGGRLNADLIISESAIGGIDFSGGAYGMIDKLRVHNIKGGVAYQSPSHASAGTMPSVNYNTSGHFAINSLSCQRSGSGQTGQDELRIERGRLIIGNMTLNGHAKPGHGIKQNGGVLEIANLDVDNIKGNAADGNASAAWVGNATGNYAYAKISGFVSNSDVGIRKVKNMQAERIDLQMRNVATPWGGVKKNSAAQRWQIDAVGTVSKSSRFVGAVEFNPLSTDVQKVKIAHGLLYGPNISNVQVSVADSPTSIIDSPAEYASIAVYEVDDEFVTIGMKLKVPGTLDTTPRINIHMEV